MTYNVFSGTLNPTQSISQSIYNRGWLVVMKFTGRHWLALAPSNLQSSRLGLVL